jgi:SCY1-like protein 1
LIEDEQVFQKTTKEFEAELGTMSWLSVIGGAATSLLSKGGGIPNLPGFGLGHKESNFEGQTIWTQYDGIKRDDNSSVSIFVLDIANANQLNSNSFIGSKDRKLLLGFAKNSLKKLRSLRHPDILKFIDGTETDSAVYIITEKVSNLSVKLDQLKMSNQTAVEWKIWGLSRIVASFHIFILFLTYPYFKLWSPRERKHSGWLIGLVVVL